VIFRMPSWYSALTSVSSTGIGSGITRSKRPYCCSIR
jgi:hypothetical protein